MPRGGGEGGREREREIERDLEGTERELVKGQKLGPTRLSKD